MLKNTQGGWRVLTPPALELVLILSLVIIGKYCWKYWYCAIIGGRKSFTGFISLMVEVLNWIHCCMKALKVLNQTHSEVNLLAVSYVWEKAHCGTRSWSEHRQDVCISFYTHPHVPYRWWPKTYTPQWLSRKFLLCLHLAEPERAQPCSSHCLGTSKHCDKQGLSLEQLQVCRSRSAEGLANGSTGL